jgi:hypothetical protein
LARRQARARVKPLRWSASRQLVKMTSVVVGKGRPDAGIGDAKDLSPTICE